jgi:hypothetical protein
MVSLLKAILNYINRQAWFQRMRLDRLPSKLCMNEYDIIPTQCYLDLSPLYASLLYTLLLIALYKYKTDHPLLSPTYIHLNSNETKRNEPSIINHQDGRWIKAGTFSNDWSTQGIYLSISSHPHPFLILLTIIHNSNSNWYPGTPRTSIPSKPCPRPPTWVNLTKTRQ